MATDNPITAAGNSTLTTPAHLQATLEQLKTRRADQFDPVRFQYIDSMVRRATLPNAAAAQLVTNKAAEALADYQQRYRNAESTASQQLAALRQQCPTAAASAQQLFAAGHFKALHRLCEQQLQKARRNHSLKDLCQQLANTQPSANHGPDLDQVLHQQEEAIRQTLLADQPAQHSASEAAPPPVTLRSRQKLRRLQASQSTHQIVNRAIRERPQSPGPLNPQMLALRALTTMQALSPAYLNRFVDLMDTLRWLEHADHKTAPNKAAKKTRRKS